MEDFLLPCKNCTKKCFRTHGSKDSHHHSSYYFFKVMMGDFAQRLHIPPAFIAKLRNGGMGMDENVVLQGPTTHRWNVKLYATSKGLDFAHGWDTFVHDHRIELGDFLVFKYVSKSCFKVRIFGTTACEKNYFQQRFPIAFNKDLSIVLVGEEEKCQKAALTPKKPPPKPKNFSPSGHLAKDPKYGQNFGEEGEEKRYGATYYVSCRPPVTQEERDKALKAAKSFISSNPCYLISMKSSSVYHGFYLNFPQKGQDLLQLPKESFQVTLVDPNNKEWPVQYQGHHYRPALREGWRFFSFENNLEEGDVCVFERVDKASHKFRVHVFRVVKDCTPYNTVEISAKQNKDGNAVLPMLSPKKMKVDTDGATNLDSNAMLIEQSPKKMEVDTDGAANLPAPDVKEFQGKKEKGSRGSRRNCLTVSKCSPPGCRRSPRFVQKRNLADSAKKELLQKKIGQNPSGFSQKITSVDEEDDDVVILWDSSNNSPQVPSSGALIPFETPIHIPKVHSMTKSIIPKVHSIAKSIFPVLELDHDALRLVVALSPEEATSQVHMNGEANWETGSASASKEETQHMMSSKHIGGGSTSKEEDQQIISSQHYGSGLTSKEEAQHILSFEHLGEHITTNSIV